MFFKTSVCIFCIIALPCMSSASAERRLLCSSERVSVWYSFEGPLYYLSVTGFPCLSKKSFFTLTYTIIPMTTVARFGYHARVYYKGQLWFEHTQPEVPCEDAKICYIIKGETLHDTFPIHFKRFGSHTPQGEYQLYLDVNIVDDFEKMLPLHVNVTVQVKGTGS